MVKKCLFLILFITVTAVYAAQVPDITITDRLAYDSSLSEIINIHLTNNTDSSFSIILPDKAYNMSINGMQENDTTLTTALNCTECQINIVYNLPSASVQDPGNDNLYIFDRTINFPRIPQLLKYLVYLPEGYSIANSTMDSPSVVPSANLLTDGNYIIISWTDNNPTLPAQYHIRYENSEAAETAGYIWRQDISTWYIWLMLIIALLAGIAIGLLTHRYWRIKTAPRQLPMIHKSLFTPDEQKVLDFLKSARANKEPVNQKEIGRQLNWSKSKVSAILTTLDYKKIIEREKFGRNYKVKLIKKIDES